MTASGSLAPVFPHVPSRSTRAGDLSGSTIRSNHRLPRAADPALHEWTSRRSRIGASAEPESRMLARCVDATRTTPERRGAAPLRGDVRENPYGNRVTHPPRASSACGTALAGGFSHVCSAPRVVAGRVGDLDHKGGQISAPVDCDRCSTRDECRARRVGRLRASTRPRASRHRGPLC